jgi:hypothetical protein
MPPFEEGSAGSGSFGSPGGRIGSLMTPMCSCGRKPVIYICQKKDCTRNHQQPYYCQHCKDDELHPHYPVVRIRNVPQQNRMGPDSKWQELAFKVDSTLKAAIPKFKHFSPLVRYLENETARCQKVDGSSEVQWITKDYEELCKINKDIDWISD